jgi:hypothetical protein
MTLSINGSLAPSAFEDLIRRLLGGVDPKPHFGSPLSRAGSEPQDLVDMARRSLEARG